MIQNVYNRNLAIALIEDDLVNNKLVNGLNDLGLNAGDYYLQLSETILTMIGLDTENDSVQDLYFNLTQRSNFLNLSDLSKRSKQLNDLATEIYEQLMKYRQENQSD